MYLWTKIRERLLIFCHLVKCVSSAVHNVNGQHIGESDYWFSVTAQLPWSFRKYLFSQSKFYLPREHQRIVFYNLLISANPCWDSKRVLASMIYFDSDMSKSTNTVVYFDWKTVIYIYGIFKLFLLRKVKRDRLYK